MPVSFKRTSNRHFASQAKYLKESLDYATMYSNADNC